MQKAVGVDLFCSRCNAESVHQASISEGRIDSFRCLTCGATTAARVHKAQPAAQLEPLSAIQLDHLNLGQVEYPLEGGITLPEAPFMQQGLAAVRIASTLRELDCRVLRLNITSAEQLQLIVTLKAATGLPVLADIGSNLTLASHVARSRADGLIFTCTDPEQVEGIGVATSPIFDGIIVMRTEGPDLYWHLQTAIQGVQTLCRWNQRKLAVTPIVENPAHFSILARALHERLPVPLRAELPMAGVADDQTISCATALGTAFHQPGIVVAALPVLTPATRSMYEVAAEAIRYLSRGAAVSEDRVGILVYLAGKAFGRVISKPGRILGEMESSPGVFVRSLPSRVVSKPQRVIGEIRRLVRVSS